MFNFVYFCSKHAARFSADKCIFNNGSRKKYNGKDENFATCVTRNAEIAIKEAA
jgi:hypothetical protein